MRRLSRAEVGLLVTVLIWSLNFTLTKYVLDHGFQPLAYSSLRFTTAALLFAGVAFALERSLRMRRRDLAVLFGAVVVGIWLNQIGFVYSLTYTTASTAALVFGTLPIFTILAATRERRRAALEALRRGGGDQLRGRRARRGREPRARSPGARPGSRSRSSARRRGRSTPSRSRR